MDLTHIYGIFHPKKAKYIFHETFSNVEYISGHNTTLSKYKNLDIISCILLDHNRMKLEIVYPNLIETI